jgi:geranylgeranyl pyrophosphate synthase
MHQTSSVGIMKSKTAAFFDLVRPELYKVEERMRANPGKHHPSLDAAIEHLLSSGGKRIRPTLVLLAGGMLGADRDHLITLAASIEMLHTATLVHDDLIDGSLLRRGIPTLNAKWSPGATVLTGDYIFARAAHLAAAIGSQELMVIFARTLMTIVNGEISQLFGPRSDDTRQEYIDRIYAKTASLFEVATEGSAILCARSKATIASMKSFGYNIGIAFQIMDDVLDFIGDQDQIGKPVANDLRQGVITLPALCYLESNPNHGTLREMLLRGEMDNDELDHLIDEIRASSAIEKALDQAREFVAAGEAQLDDMPASPERDALYDLAQYIANRKN